jgi:flagellar biogenesis protein FliO
MDSLNVAILGEAAASAAQVSVADTVIRTLVFLALLALGGYFFVLFHRRGYFANQKSTAANRGADEIRIVAVRLLNGRKYLAVVEHFGRRFLLALTNDKIDKISEWDTVEKS